MNTSSSHTVIATQDNGCHFDCHCHYDYYYLDIGGITGGTSRRIIDAWQPPGWHHFLQED